MNNLFISQNVSSSIGKVYINIDGTTINTSNITSIYFEGLTNIEYEVVNSTTLVMTNPYDILKEQYNYAPDQFSARLNIVTTTTEYSRGIENTEFTNLFNGLDIYVDFTR